MRTALIALMLALASAPAAAEVVATAPHGAGTLFFTDDAGSCPQRTGDADARLVFLLGHTGMRLGTGCAQRAGGIVAVRWNHGGVLFLEASELQAHSAGGAA